MKLEQEKIDHVRNAFAKMQNKEDLLHLMNEVKPWIYGPKTVPFQLRQLTWYANPKLAKIRYAEFKIKKKSGAERSIHAPVKGLKAIQKTLSFIFQSVFEPHQAAMGFVRSKSIVDNAKLHAGNRYVYNIDLKDFFPSITEGRVWKCLQLKPFSLINNEVIKEIIGDNTFKYFHGVENRFWPKESNKVLVLSYNGLHLKEGKRILRLKAGGWISYKVKFNKEKNGEGDIYIYEDKSDYKQIIDLAHREIEDENSDLEATLNSILLFVITSHIKKSIEKDSRSNLANFISSLCCVEMEVEHKVDLGEYEKRNVLPQGAPTSPVLTNIICHRLDVKLTGVANRFGLRYSRYADDITFSSMHNVYKSDSDFLNELHRVIAEQGFHIKESKTRLQKDGYRKEVTGLLINERVNVQQRYIKQLRMWLYYWERYGYDRAYDFFLKQYTSEKLNVKGKPDMRNVIGGKLDFLKMVKGADNELYLKLRRRFDELGGNSNSLNNVLDLWEEKGIEVAMKKFYPNILIQKNENKAPIIGGKELKLNMNTINYLDCADIDDSIDDDFQDSIDLMPDIDDDFNNDFYDED